MDKGVCAEQRAASRRAGQGTGTGQPGRDVRARTAGIEQLGQDGQDMTAGTGQDSQDRRTGTGKSERQTG